MTSVRSALVDLAERSCALELDDVPAALRDHAAVVFADTVGVIMAGTTQQEMAKLLAGSTLLGIHRSSSRRPHAVVLSPGYPAAPPVIAAMINGAAATSLELDEGVRPTGHPSAHIVPAVLATAQACGNGGEETLTAFLSGYEVAARLFEAFELKPSVHPHGHFGAVGAAVAVARLRRVSPSAAALAAATVPVLGTWEACYEGATMRNFYTGLGAATGVAAADLAASGFTGSLAALTGRASGISKGIRDLAALTDAIDASRLRIAHDYFKLHSACALSHPAIDAVLAMGPLDLHQVRDIEVETGERAMRLARASVGNPLSSRFSLPFAVAVAVKHGRAGPELFSADREVAELASRVTVRSDPEMSAKWPEQLPARVTVNMANGQTRRHQVDNPRGHFTNRPDAETMREKFLQLSWAPRAPELYSRLLDIASERDVFGLFAETAGRSRSRRSDSNVD
jgi:2-methylcitrate dehydratase PrpD